MSNATPPPQDAARGEMVLKVSKGMRRVHVCCGSFDIMICRVEEDAPDDLIVAAMQALSDFAKMKNPAPPAPDAARVIKVLRSLEWSGDLESCPSCGRFKGKGHEQGCELDAALLRPPHPDAGET